MEQMPSTPKSRQGNPASSPLLRIARIGCAAFLAIALLIALVVFRVYGTDTHHANRDSIWWSGQCRSLIPPAAADITLRRDFLDHYAIYTIAEKDLNAFLDKHFASPGETLDSFSERSPADPKLVGKPFGPLAWIVTADTVSYSYTAGNGGAHKFYHDTKTGLTYQSSAYW